VAVHAAPAAELGPDPDVLEGDVGPLPSPADPPPIDEPPPLPEDAPYPDELVPLNIDIDGEEPWD
jgi:hypothetical protein